MRSRSPIDLLLYEATIKPRIGDLVARINEISEEEITSLSLPLPWYRDALRRLKRLREREALGQTGLGHLDGIVVEGVLGDPDGEIRQWIGSPTFLGFGKRAVPTEVATGHLLWLPLTGGVWLDSLYADAIDPRITPNTTAIGRATRTAYMVAFREEVARRHGIVRGTVVPPPSSGTRPSPISGVSFRRIP